jgi:quercetin dioxygenase-like cupin family protein
MLRAWAALSVLALACASTITPITSEPHHHLVMTTDRVRVFDVHVAPHTVTLMHQHDYDYLFVTLGAATVTSARYRDGVSQLVLHDGEVRYTKGGFAHTASDDTDQPFHNVTIELLHPSTNVGACALPCVMSSDQWTVSSVTVAPGGHVDAHDALAIAISDVDMGAPLRGGPGTLATVNGALANNGATDAKVVLLEFK